MKAQRQARAVRRAALRRTQRGAVLIEFLVVFMPMTLLFVGVWQVCELYASQLVLARASSAAGRAASVVLPDNPDFYAGVPQDTLEGQRKADVELAAGMILAASPHFTKNFSVNVGNIPQRDFGAIEVTVAAELDCRGLRLLCPLSDTIALSATSSHAYHGAGYDPTPLGEITLAAGLSRAGVSSSGDCSDLGAGGASSAGNTPGSGSLGSGGSNGSGGAKSRGARDGGASGGGTNSAHGGTSGRSSADSGGTASRGLGGASGAANDDSCPRRSPVGPLASRASLVRAVFARASGEDGFASCQIGTGGASGVGGTGGGSGTVERTCTDAKYEGLQATLTRECSRLDDTPCQPPRAALSDKNQDAYCDKRFATETLAKRCADAGSELLKRCFGGATLPLADRTLHENGTAAVYLCASAREEYCSSLTHDQLCKIAAVNVHGVSGQRLIKGTNGKIAVIGRTMGDYPRRSVYGVVDYTKELRGDGFKYDTELFAGPQIQQAWKDEIEELKLRYQTDHLSPEVIRTTEFYRQNLAWARKLVDEGYTVIDVGNPNGWPEPSAFYDGEMATVFNDLTASRTVDLKTLDCPKYVRH